MKPLLIGNCKICGSERLENPDHCASCAAEIRKAERFAQKQKVVHQVKKVSPKMAKKNMEYADLRKSFLKMHKFCGAKLLGCTKQSQDVHHTAGRGENYLNIQTWMAVCRHCHTVLHDKLGAEERREKGLLITPPKQTI